MTGRTRTRIQFLAINGKVSLGFKWCLLAGNLGIQWQMRIIFFWFEKNGNSKGKNFACSGECRVESVICDV